MKSIQKVRLIVQLICVVLTLIGFFMNFRVTMIIIMVTTLIGGAYYCGWVCPFGTLQDIASKIGKMLKIKKYKMPKIIQRYLKYSRYVLLVAYLVFSFDIIYAIFSYDPRVNLIKYLGGSFSGIVPLIILISFLVIGMFFERPFCNYLCIEGAKYGVISSLRVFTIKRDEASCVGCTKCDKACPMNIEVSKMEQVQSLQCINCFECVSACPIKDTLSYEKISFTHKMKRKYTAAICIIASIAVVSFISIGITGKLPLGMKLGEDRLTNTTTGTSSETTIDGKLVSVGEAAGIDDGVYEGTGMGFRGEIKVEVTVTNEIIIKIKVIENIDDKKFYNRAEPVVTKDIIESQSSDVDTVSGATYSSIGIIDAVADALENARK
ncbi:ferredoxin [Vallitalea longa]|uniref:Ferredoxin n=1 Tax=Vallitalea longa TaxID=2936439 RepID=A0A9W6DFV4_9FIRM|nr:4Fe-4S binding protein [Vallitalea longa]GKX29104.1 ferredoxin [Vallitalea longa]